MRRATRVLGCAAGALVMLVGILRSPVRIAAYQAPDPSARCAALAASHLPHTTVTTAEAIRDGSFTAPGATSPISGLPPFCRVAGEIRPTPDSHIGFEVWMPLENWNHKLGGVGNIGFAGVMQFDYGRSGAGPLIRNSKLPFGFTMSDQLKRGYATAATDTGHRMEDGDNDPVAFAVGHPERLVDFGYRAVHETTVVAKALVVQFYGRAPEHTYWVGQSTGGEQGLIEAQRFPNDYDGIAIGTGTPNIPWMHVRVLDAQLAVVNSGGLDAAHRSLLHDAVIAACDADDGLADGLISDPPRCTFDPGSLECRPGASDTQSCLTSAQVTAVRRVYEGLRDPNTGRQLAAGLAKGSELTWGASFPPGGLRAPDLSFMRSVLFQNPAWDWRTFDFSRAADRDFVSRRERMLAPILNADNADLRAFRHRGGKMLHFQGWSDQWAAPMGGTNYYDSIARMLGGTGDPQAALRQVQTFYRLFMVPGMVHGLGNGFGPATFDLLSALEDWVERGKAPDSLVATQFDQHGVPVRSRPLCSYPLVAHYRGSGDVDQAASFSCQ